MLVVNSKLESNYIKTSNTCRPSWWTLFYINWNVYCSSDWYCINLDGQVKVSDVQSYWYFDHLDSSNTSYFIYVQHQRGGGSNGTTESSGSHIQHMDNMVRR